MWIAGKEFYDPHFAKADGLKELGMVEFTKLLGSLKAEFSRSTERLTVAVTGLWRSSTTSSTTSRTARSIGAVAELAMRW